METVSKSEVLPYSAEQMFGLVNDIARYPEFLPWCTSATIHTQTNAEIIASLVLQKGHIHKGFTTRNELTPYSKMEMHLIDGPFKHLHGLWQFETVDQTHCRVSVDITYAFNSRIIAMMLGPVFHHVADTLLNAFVARAKTLYGSQA